MAQTVKFQENNSLGNTRLQTRGESSNRRSGDMVSALMESYYAKTGTPIVGERLQSGSQTIDEYKSGTLAVFEYMKTVGVTDMFIVQTGHFNGTDADGTHDAAYVAIHDAYHFHQDAYNAVGTAAGKAIAEIYNK